MIIGNLILSTFDINLLQYTSVCNSYLMFCSNKVCYIFKTMILHVVQEYIGLIKSKFNLISDYFSSTTSQ